MVRYGLMSVDTFTQHMRQEGLKSQPTTHLNEPEFDIDIEAQILDSIEELEGVISDCIASNNVEVVDRLRRELAELRNSLK